MGLKTDSDSPMLAKISAVIILIAFFLFLIAFGAPNWAATNPKFVSRVEYIGLWRYCTDPVGGSQTCDNFIDITSGDWLKCCQSFMTLAFFGMLACIALVMLAAFVPDFQGEPKPIIGAIVAMSCTSFFMLIGVSVWGAKYDEYFTNKDALFDSHSGQLSWAYGLAVTSLIMTVSAVVLMVLELLVGRR